MKSYEEFIENNCGIDSSNKNTIIYNLIKNYIQNYTGEDSLVLETDDNQVFQLTTSSNEKNTKEGKNSNNYNLSMIDLGNCEETLKRENNINSNVSLIIYKLEKVGTVASQKNIQYEVYNPENKNKLDLSVCSNDKIDIYIPVTLDEDKLELHQNLLSYGYDLFNPNDSFYQDICAGYTSSNGTDILLADRKKYFFNDTETACQQNCVYSQYSAETKHLKCECSAAEEEIEPEKSNKFDGIIIFKSFYEVLKYSNFLVLKCYKLVFSYKGQFLNWGSLILIIYFILYTIFNCIYFAKGYFYVKLFSAKMIFNNNLFNTEDNKILGRRKRRRRSRTKIVDNHPPVKKKSKTKR